nr:MAG TPA: hypothetical protein [Caudoviricetes sp.]DAU13793.1 MAG TPA: hypothetical protein [Caudoviricetes sp.]
MYVFFYFNNYSKLAIVCRRKERLSSCTFRLLFLYFNMRVHTLMFK